MEDFLDGHLLIRFLLARLTYTTGRQLFLLVLQLQLPLKGHLYTKFIQVDMFQDIHGKRLFRVRKILVENLQEHVILFQLRIDKSHNLCDEAILTDIPVYQFAETVFLRILHRLYAVRHDSLHNGRYADGCCSRLESLHHIVHLLLREHLILVDVRLDRIHPRLIHRSIQNRLGVIVLERLLNHIGIIPEVNHQRVVLTRATAVQTAERLDALDTAQNFVHIHRMQ